MITRNLLPLLTLAIGVALGFWMSHTGQSASPKVSEAAKPAESKSPAIGLVPSNPSKDRPKDSLSTREQAFEQLLDEMSAAKRLDKLTQSMTLAELESSLKRLESRPKDPPTYTKRAALLLAWARLDPQGAWKAALATASLSERLNLLGVVAGEMAKTNPDAAVKLAMSIESPSMRKKVISALCSEWGKDDPNAALAYRLKHTELPMDSFALESIISSISVKDPGNAARLALSIPLNETRDIAMRSALGRWMEADPMTARRWADSLTDPLQRDRALNALVAVPSLDPKTAMELAGRISSSETRQAALKDILLNWVGNDPTAALKYVSTMDTNNLDRNVEWAIGYATRDFTEQEQSKFLAQLPEGKLKESIVSSIVRNYTSSGRYSQGVRALNLMPDSKERDHSLHSLATSWAQADPKAVQGWIKQQADSSDRDLVIAGYSCALATTDVTAAMKWAESIPDQSVQHTALINVVGRWMRADPSAAEAWLNATPLLSKFEKDTAKRYGRTGMFIPSTPIVKQKR